MSTIEEAVAEHMRLVDELWQAVEDFDLSDESHAQDETLLQVARDARSAVEASARRLAAVPEGWKLIESAPKDKMPILVWSEARGGCWIAKYKPVYESGYRPENPWFNLMLNANWHPGNGTAALVPTHWMPLPASPQPQQEQKK